MSRRATPTPCDLGPVNTMRIFIDGDHFFTGQGALSAVYLPYISENVTQSWEKMAPSLRVGSPHSVNRYQNA